jgi:flagellar biosynthesis protein FlhB
MSEKQFPPSVKRLTKARKQGKVVKSRMVSVAVSWSALAFAIIPCLAWVKDGSLVQYGEYRVFAPTVALAHAAWFACATSLMVVGVLAVSGVAVAVVQTRLLFLPNQLFKGLEQYRPGAFIGRMRGTGLDAAVGVLRCCCLALVVAPIVTEVLTCTPTAFHGNIVTGLQDLLLPLRRLYVRGAATLIAIAAVAYFLARWRFFRQHKMSLQEMKDEYKEDEGDPHAKTQRKHEHRALLLSEIEQRVKRSKVVVIRRRTR